MNHNIESLKVVIFINENEVKAKDLSAMEVRAITDELRKIWQRDDYYRVWFDIEEAHPTRNRWEIMVKVQCYYFPDKSETAPIPEKHLNEVLGNNSTPKRVRLYPFVDSVSRLNSSVVEVAYVV
jgi:hypothetical protein